MVRQFIDSGTRKLIRIVLLAGGDLIQSFAVPDLWTDEDVQFYLIVSCIIY